MKCYFFTIARTTPKPWRRSERRVLNVSNLKQNIIRKKQNRQGGRKSRLFVRQKYDTGQKLPFFYVVRQNAFRASKIKACGIFSKNRYDTEMDTKGSRKKQKEKPRKPLFFGVFRYEPLGTRTRDNLIKSQALKPRKPLFVRVFVFVYDTYTTLGEDAVQLFCRVFFRFVQMGVNLIYHSAISMTEQRRRLFLAYFGII